MRGILNLREVSLFFRSCFLYKPLNFSFRIAHTFPWSPHKDLFVSFKKCKKFSSWLWGSAVTLVKESHCRKWARCGEGLKSSKLWCTYNTLYTDCRAVVVGILNDLFRMDGLVLLLLVLQPVIVLEIEIKSSIIMCCSKQGAACYLLQHMIMDNNKQAEACCIREEKRTQCGQLNQYFWCTSKSLGSCPVVCLA